MSSKKLAKIGNFLRYWKDAVLHAGYNKHGVECFYITCKGKVKEIPHSWEMIADNGIIESWLEIKTFLCKDHSLAYDAKSDRAVMSGMFGE